MIERGADVNARMTGEPRTRFRKSFNWIGATPLIMAAKVADTPMVRVLLDRGADPTITTDENTTLLMVTAGVGIASPGEDGGTEEEALECTQLVLRLGGNINAIDDNGETPLHGAAYRLAPSVVQLLIDNGAETFTVQNQAGWTPLHIATGVLRQGTYKESPQAAALLRQAMTERGLSTTLEEPVTVSGKAPRPVALSFERRISESSCDASPTTEQRPDVERRSRARHLHDDSNRRRRPRDETSAGVEGRIHDPADRNDGVAGCVYRRTGRPRGGDLPATLCEMPPHQPEGGRSAPGRWERGRA